MIWWEKKQKNPMPNNQLFSNTMGLGAGFTTMVGNMAGAFSNLYFLAMRLPKEHFIGTVAWLFLIVNAFKIPFHIWVWHTITIQSISINLMLLPFLLIGFGLGLKLENYRQIILSLTFVAALFLLLNL
jgi:hypothetical protein